MRETIAALLGLAFGLFWIVGICVPLAWAAIKVIGRFWGLI